MRDMTPDVLFGALQSFDEDEQSEFDMKMSCLTQRLSLIWKHWPLTEQEKEFITKIVSGLAQVILDKERHHETIYSIYARRFIDKMMNEIYYNATAGSVSL